MHGAGSEGGCWRKSCQLFVRSGDFCSFVLLLLMMTTNRNLFLIYFPALFREGKLGVNTNKGGGGDNSPGGVWEYIYMALRDVV